MSTTPRQPDAVIAVATLAAAADAPAAAIAVEEEAALERLISHAGQDTGQCRRVADFLLAWLNSGSCGAFDLILLRALDIATVVDMMTVFGLLGRILSYPDSLGYKAEFKAIVHAWRPELGD